MLDPNTNSRREFTNGILETFPVVEDAAPEWKKLAEDLKELVAKRAFHDAMKPNIDQAYMTPAASKNEVYFMWDFVSRTLSMLASAPPDLGLADMNAAEKEAWTDVQSRAQMAKHLILDTNAGMLDIDGVKLLPRPDWSTSGLR